MRGEIAICFYNRFSYDIAQIRTAEQRVNVLSDMQEAFSEAVRNKPSIRNELAEAYQQLKIECEHAV